MLCISEINILAYNEIRFYTYMADNFDFFKNMQGNSAGGGAHTLVNKQTCIKKPSTLGKNINMEKD